MTRALVFLAAFLAAGPGFSAASRSLRLVVVDETPLAKTGGRVDQLIAAPGGQWLVRDASYDPAEAQAVELYDAQGRKLRKIGSFGHKPGEYFRLKDMDLAADGTLWVADIIGRVGLFRLDGQLVTTLLIQNPGFQVDSLVLPPGADFFYLGGCLPKKTYIEDGCRLAHRYSLADRRFAASFGESSPEVVPRGLLGLQDVLLASDDKGRIYVADAPILAVSRFEEGKPDGVTWPLPLGAAQAPRPEANGRSPAYGTTFRIDRLVAVAPDLLAVSVAKPHDAGFLLTVLDAAGKPLLLEIPTAGRLVGKTAAGELLFVRQQAGSWLIARQRLELVKPGAR
jgi:hypothetical protein